MHDISEKTLNIYLEKYNIDNIEKRDIIINILPEKYDPSIKIFIIKFYNKIYKLFNI